MSEPGRPAAPESERALMSADMDRLRDAGHFIGVIVGSGPGVVVVSRVVPGGWLASRSKALTPDFLHTALAPGASAVYVNIARMHGGGGPRRGHPVGISSAFVDLDRHDADPRTWDPAALDRLHKLGASVVVRSGGGFHAYWCLEDAPLAPESVRPVLLGLADALADVGADVRSAEPARVLRLPGSTWNKAKPARPVELVGDGGRFWTPAGHLAGECDPEPRRHRLEDLPRREPGRDLVRSSRRPRQDLGALLELVTSCGRETSRKADGSVRLQCLKHDDANPSAVVFSDSGGLWCSACETFWPLATWTRWPAVASWGVRDLGALATATPGDLVPANRRPERPLDLVPADAFPVPRTVRHDIGPRILRAPAAHVAAVMAKREHERSATLFDRAAAFQHLDDVLKALRETMKPEQFESSYRVLHAALALHWITTKTGARAAFSLGPDDVLMPFYMVGQVPALHALLGYESDARGRAKSHRVRRDLAASLDLLAAVTVQLPAYPRRENVYAPVLARVMEFRQRRRARVYRFHPHVAEQVRGRSPAWSPAALVALWLPARALAVHVQAQAIAWDAATKGKRGTITRPLPDLARTAGVWNAEESHVNPSRYLAGWAHELTAEPSLGVSLDEDTAMLTTSIPAMTATAAYPAWNGRPPVPAWTVYLPREEREALYRQVEALPVDQRPEEWEALLRQHKGRIAAFGNARYALTRRTTRPTP